MTTSEPLVRGAMEALAEAWPAALPFAALLKRALAAAGPDAPAQLVAERLREVLLEAHLARVVQLHGCAPPVASSAGERPRVSGLARAQLAAGAPVVSSLLHANVRLADADAALVPLLDSTRDRAALQAAIADEQELEPALGRLAALGLLHESGSAPA